MITFLICYLIIGVNIAANENEGDWLGWLFGWLPILFVRAFKLIHKELKS
jgi:hypothetical protein